MKKQNTEKGMENEEWRTKIPYSPFPVPHSTRRGFTLLEATVSIGLFTIIMFIATSAFLSIVNADRKARVTRIATDNLNVALEDMSRRIKTGTTYYCGASDVGGVGDCASGTVFSFNDQFAVRTTYKWGQGTTGCGSGYSTTQRCIVRVDSTGAFPITSPEIDIQNLKFVVTGSYPCGATPPSTTCLVDATHDAKQPVVVILVSGTLGKGTAISTFNMQTTVTQRAYDN